jgi:hypothetical protein
MPFAAHHASEGKAHITGVELQKHEILLKIISYAT